jgi:pilus assembly protein Flp/PilA
VDDETEKGNEEMVNELLLRLMARLQTAEEGQGMVEYALILALVSVVAITILIALGSNVKLVFSSASSALSTAV